MKIKKIHNKPYYDTLAFMKEFEKINKMLYEEEVKEARFSFEYMPDINSKETSTYRLR